MPHCSKKFFLFAWAIFGAGFLPDLSAQLPLPLNEQLRREQAAQQIPIRQERARRELGQEQALRRGEEPIPEPLPNEPAFYIQKIEVQDVTRLSQAKIQRIVARYQGSRFHAAKIDRLISDLTNAYIDAGYITSRIYIPPQQVASGTLILVAVEGKMQSLNLNQGKWRDRLKAWMAFPAMPRGILRLQNLEQGLDQINRAASADARVTLEPGDEVGSTRVIVTNTVKDPLRGFLALDNYGSDGTGILRAKAQVEWDNLLNVNDVWSLAYLGTEESNAFSASLSIPFRWWTLEMSASYSESLVDLTPSAELLYYNYAASIKLTQVIFRNTYHKTTMGIGFDFNATQTHINEAELAPDRIGVLRASVNHLWRRPNTAVIGDLGCSLQIPGLWEPDPVNGTAPEGEDDSVFAIVTASLSVQHQFTSWLTAQVNFQGQYSPKAANPTQQIYLTEYYTVRGFRSLSYGVDAGGYLRSELICQPYANEKGWKGIVSHFSPYAFFDAGYGIPYAADSGGEWLASVGGGIRLSWGPVSSEIWTAVPIVHPDNLEPNGVEAWWSVSLKIF